MKEVKCPNCGENISLNLKLKTKCPNCNAMIATDALSVLQDNDYDFDNFDDFDNESEWDLDFGDD